MSPVTAACSAGLHPRITVDKARKRPRMTRAKAERLVAALAAVRECEDAPDAPSFDDVRAAVEPWL